jgi:hypothetical protein
MRLVISAGLLALVAACLLTAQAPMGLGPGASGTGLIDIFDWYAGTPSGCTAGPRGMCVGGGTGGVLPQGDTYYFTGWLANANQLPITTGLPIVGTFNDGSSKTCSNNMALLQLAEFSWSNRNASRIYEINCMSSYSPGSNAPAGWFGHCSNGDEATTGNICGWKSRTPFALDGLLYLPVARQIGSGSGSTHDGTMIVSADSGQTWKNPYTVAHAGAAQADGDAPKCGAVDGHAGSTCLDASYPGSIMWPAMTSTSANGMGTDQWYFYQYGQDGNLPADVADDCNPATYVCLILGDGSYARVLRTDMPSLDATKWQYVASLDSRYKPTWTSTFADRKLGNIISGNDSEIGRPRSFLSGPVYLKEFHSYLLLGGTWVPHVIYFMTSQGPFGPWKVAGSVPISNAGFATVALGIEYTVISTNPPRVQVTVPTDNIQYSLQFSKWDITLGMQPYGNGDVPTYTDTGRGRLNSGWIFGAGDLPGTFPRNGLAWAFDFKDGGGGNGYPYFHDLATNSAVLYPCWQDGPVSCGRLSKGASATSTGIAVSDGYLARFESNISDLNAGTTGGNRNAPAAMQGNGTFSVAGVFRMDGTSGGSVFWQTGDTSPGNAAVILDASLNVVSNNYLTVDWGFGNRYQSKSAFIPTIGNWYYMNLVITAGTPDPTVKLWVGINGTLTDVLSGIPRTVVGGSPPQTPNVTAAPIKLGGPFYGHVANASYAGLLVYSRALSDAESAGLYQSFKIKMPERGITLQ